MSSGDRSHASGAHLVQIEAGHPVATIALGSAEVVIGRDPGATLRVSAPGVSRRHATVRSVGGRHAITDLRSANGTTVNGTPVNDSVMLATGDLIEIGGEVAFRYEAACDARSPRVAAAIALAALLVLGGVGAWLWLGVIEPDIVLDQATERAREGLEAARAGQWHAAKASLQYAYGLLYRNGHLDDVQRGRMQVAMGRIGDRMGDGVDLWSVFQDAVERDAEARKQEAVASVAKGRIPGATGTPAQGGACRLDAVEPSQFDGCLRKQIELVLIALRQEPKGVPEDFAPKVAARLRIENKFLRGSFERGRPLVPMLRQELEAARMPPLLHYVALIESGYKNDAVSPAKAAGMWQLMPGTARQFGLVVNPPVDERRDPIKATRVAAKYLRDLTFEWGGDALLLAIASYNRGENGVRRELKKLDDPWSDRSFWRLVEAQALPKETIDYIPRFMAAAVAGEGGLPSPTVLAAAGH